MATENKCRNCGSEEIDYDPARGDAACVACGTVVQQSLIVNEVAFAEDGQGRSNMVGQHVGADGQPSHSVLPGHSRQATFNTMMNARRQMNQLAALLRISSGNVEQGVRLYRLAVERNFHKGRRIINLSCACLYVVCRMERTPHMLLDFADVSQVNVFTLGHTFLKLVRLLQISLPLIDPSLYMHRFASRLEFGESQNAVAMTALRIAARMQRDWLTHGRRPAGLCGAALLTAAAMHGFYRSFSEIARVVRIGNIVLRNRLRELDRTPTALMTAAQIDAGGGDDGKKGSLLASTLGEECNPPAYERLQAKKATAEALKSAQIRCDVEQDEESDAIDAAESGQRSEKQTINGRERGESPSKLKKNLDDERSKQMAADERVPQLMKEAMANDEMQALDNESDIALQVSASVENNRSEQEAQSEVFQDGTDNDNREQGERNDPEDWIPDQEAADLSDLDEEDTAKYISTEEEYRQKEVLWTETNKDYLEKQARLEAMKRDRPDEYNRLRPGQAAKKRKRQGTGGQTNRIGNDETSVTTALTNPSTSKSSKKLNYSVLQSLEEGDGLVDFESVDAG